MKSKFLPILSGAIVAQIWATLSWMCLPWHSMDYRSFKDPEAVIQSVAENLDGDGIYMLPNFDEAAHTDEALMKKWWEDAEKGPFAFISARPNGVNPSMGRSMAMGFLMNVIMAFVLFWLVGKTSMTCFWGRSGFIALAAGIGGMYPYLSNYFWWHFPAVYGFAGAADLFLTWALAGMAMMKVKDKLNPAST